MFLLIFLKSCGIIFYENKNRKKGKSKSCFAIRRFRTLALIVIFIHSGSIQLPFPALENYIGKPLYSYSRKKSFHNNCTDTRYNSILNENELRLAVGKVWHVATRQNHRFAYLRGCTYSTLVFHCFSTNRVIYLCIVRLFDDALDTLLADLLRNVHYVYITNNIHQKTERKQVLKGCLNF